MPAPFNYTNVSDLGDLFEYNNQVTGPAGTHYFGDLMVFGLWVVAFLVFSYGPRPHIKALIISSFITIFFAAMLDILGYIDPAAMALPVAGWLLGIVVDKLTESD